MNKLLPLSTSLLLLAGSASAQVEFFWDGETDGDWTDVTNWDTTGAAGGDPAAIPTAGDDANLTSAGLGSTIDLGGTAVIRNFDIQGGADDFIIGSGAVGSQTLDLSGNFVSRSGEQTVNANIELDLNKNIANRHNTKALTINGDISSSGNFKFGAAGDAGFDDGLIVVNGDVTSNGGSGNITLDGKSEQVVRFNGGTYSFNYLNVSSGTVQVVDSSLDNGGRYVLGGDTTNGTLEYVGTGDLNVTNRFDIGSLNSGDAADTGGAVFKASQTSGALTISGLHGTNNNPTGNRTLTLAGANLEDNTVSSNLKDPSDGFTSSTLSLTKADAGKWILSGNNTFTGTTTVEAGQLQLANEASLYSGVLADYSEANITVESGAALVFDISGNFNAADIVGVLGQMDDAGAGGFEAGSVIGINSATGDRGFFNQSIADTADGALGFVKTGEGSLRMTKNNTYTGGTTIDAGVLEIEGGGAGGAFVGDVAISSGANLLFNKIADYVVDGVISGDGSVATNGTDFGQGPVANTGKISLTADNTFTGGLTIDAGIVEIGAGGTSGDIESDVSVASGAVFSINRDGSTVAFDFDKNITGAGSVEIQGIDNSVVSLSGTNDYSGGTTINGSSAADATVQVNANGVLGTGDVTMTGSRVVLEIGAAGLDISNKIVIADAGTVKDILMENQSGTSTLSGGIDLQDTGHEALFTVKGSLANTLDVSGATTGVGDAGIRKNFGGTLVLSGTNTFDGGIDVSGGAVLINGDSSGATGAVEVNSGIFGGTGSYGGVVNVQSGGILAPGASIETLEVGALSFESGSAFNVEVDSSVATSVGADLTIVNGDLSLDGVVTLNLSDLGAGSFAEGTLFTLLNYDGSWDGDLFTIGGDLIVDGGQFTAAGQLWSIDYNATTGGENFTGEYTNSSFVNIEAVPEPSAYALLAGMLALGSVMMRRRR